MRFKHSLAFIGGTFSSLLGFLTYKHFQPESQKMNLYFDIDSTIIHSAKYRNIKHKNISKLPHQEYIMEDDQNRDKSYYVWKRPLSNIILNILSQFNNIHIYTAATKPYADSIIDNMFNNIEFKSRQYRDSINPQTGKDIEILQPEIDNSKKILFDDTLSNYKNTKTNFYHIKMFIFTNIYDFEMLPLLGFVILANIIGINNIKKFGLYSKSLK